MERSEAVNKVCWWGFELERKGDVFQILMSPQKMKWLSKIYNIIWNAISCASRDTCSTLAAPSHFRSHVLNISSPHAAELDSLNADTSHQSRLWINNDGKESRGLGAEQVWTGERKRERCFPQVLFRMSEVKPFAVYGRAAKSLVHSIEY